VGRPHRHRSKENSMISMGTFTEAEIETAARAAHEANRAYCIAIGDLSQVPWENAPAWQRESAVKGVHGVIRGNGPEESHREWLEEKARTGWGFGLTKSFEKKTHPCFMPYASLPEAQRAKDDIFITVVALFLRVFAARRT
jgi:hypothetical protein